jgi:hypothetical protein
MYALSARIKGSLLNSIFNFQQHPLAMLEPLLYDRAAHAYKHWFNINRSSTSRLTNR